MKRLLFLCSGNYYRSRYAEILFNWQVAALDLPWRAESRGLNPNSDNPGPMSQHTMASLAAKGIPYEAYLRLPRWAADEDFAQADHVVAVKEAEHRPLMTQYFPRWLEKVEFWHVHDLDCTGPEVAIPHLDREVAALIERLSAAAKNPPRD